MTDSLSTCPDCGATLPPDSPQALCPACLMRQALASRTIVDGDHPAPASPPLTTEELGEKFPGYEILQCLGRGGMGVVYKARQKSLNRIVAIKILAPERGSESRFAERFAREAELLARLNHPHIVTIHDFGETGGLFYLVMEFVDGVNLRDLLREGKLEAKQALAIIPPICDALQYAHDKGIVHRDIKPENLLLDRDGRVKIADFGIAKLIEPVSEVCDRRTSPGHDPRRSQTAATVLAGTPDYAAPEQANGTADHRADIYALGVVLYEMLTGERPGKEPVAPSRKVEIDVRLDEIVLRALEKAPDFRYQKADIFKTQVETIASEMGSVAGASSQKTEVTSGETSPHTDPRFSHSFKPDTKTTPAPESKPTRLGKWALGLLIAAVVGFPLLWGIMGAQEVLVLCVLVLLVTLVLGLMSWRTRSGGFAALASGLGLVLLVAFAFNYLAPRRPRGPSEGGGKTTVYTPVQDATQVSPAAAAPPHEPAAPETSAVDGSSGEHFEHVQDRATAIARRYYPDFTTHMDGDRFLMQRNLREYAIHNPSKSGDVSAETHKETGPAADGFQLVLEPITKVPATQALQLASQADGPQLLDRPYWKGFVDHRFDPEKNPGISMFFDFGPTVNAEFRDEMLHLLEEEPTRLEGNDEHSVAQESKIAWTAWQELAERARNGNLAAAEAEQFFEDGIELLRRVYPDGYPDQAVLHMSGALEELQERGLVSEQRVLDFLMAFYAKPLIEPLERIREGNSVRMDVTLHQELYRQLLDYKLLNEVRSITVDGKPIEIRQLYGRSGHSANLEDYNVELQVAHLAPGRHRVRCEMDSALVKVAESVNMDTQAPPEAWPPVKRQWKRTCEAELIVHAKEAEIVRLSDDPALNPEISAGLKVESVLMRMRDGKRIAAITPQFKGSKGHPFSVGMTLKLDGRSFPCGRFAYDGNDEYRHEGDSAFISDLEDFNPPTGEAVILLTPDPGFIESSPRVDRIWGKDIVLRAIPLKRLDLGESQPKPDARHPLFKEDFEKLTNADLVLIGLADSEVSTPWLVLKERVEDGQIGASEADEILAMTNEWFRKNHPNGCGKPPLHCAQLVEALQTRRLLVERRVLDLLQALHGNGKVIAPSRTPRGQAARFTCATGDETYWHAWLGYRLLREVRSITVDGKPVEMRNISKRLINGATFKCDLMVGDHLPGEHIVRCQIFSALVVEAEMGGLSEKAPFGEWPPIKRSWKAGFETELVIDP